MKEEGGGDAPENKLGHTRAFQFRSIPRRLYSSLIVGVGTLVYIGGFTTLGWRCPHQNQDCL